MPMEIEPLDFTDEDEVVQYIRQKKITTIDLKFPDLFGRLHHVTIPSIQLNDDLFENGIPFDGSSVPGFKAVESGDMALLLDLKTA